MALLGLGIGMTMQNLVLAVQNTVGPHDLGAASSVVAFFRSLGGAIGVSVLGAVLAHRVTDYVADGLAALGVKAGAGDSGGIPDVDTLPAPVAAWSRARTATASATSSCTRRRSRCWPSCSSSSSRRSRCATEAVCSPLRRVFPRRRRLTATAPRGYARRALPTARSAPTAERSVQAAGDRPAAAEAGDGRGRTAGTRTEGGRRDQGRTWWLRRLTRPAKVRPADVGCGHGSQHRHEHVRLLEEAAWSSSAHATARSCSPPVRTAGPRARP